MDSSELVEQFIFVFALFALGAVIFIAFRVVKYLLRKHNSTGFVPIPDRFETLEQVQAELRRAGLESSQLIVCIDATKSNTWTGAKSFGGRCLHDLEAGMQNPYQEVISSAWLAKAKLPCLAHLLMRLLAVIGRTLSVFDDDNLIPAFLFGDATTGDRLGDDGGSINCGHCRHCDYIL